MTSGRCMPLALEREDAVRELARIAAEVNRNTENIGARRLHTVLTTLLEDVMYGLPEEGSGEELEIDAEFVRRELADVVADESPACSLRAAWQQSVRLAADTKIQRKRARGYNSSAPEKHPQTDDGGPEKGPPSLPRDERSPGLRGEHALNALPIRLVVDDRALAQMTLAL